MYDVILCTVKTGRVQHKYFDTNEEATQFADAWLEKQLQPHPRRRPRSAGDFRVIVNRIELPVVRSLESLTAEAA
jgi:hypothetical protein